MPDREKVIRGLECHYNVFVRCSECPYWGGEACHRDQLAKDALELLRGLEPVRPTREFSEDIENCAWWYACGVCKRAIDYKDGYCRHCGRAVKWDD